MVGGFPMFPMRTDGQRFTSERSFSSVSFCSVRSGRAVCSLLFVAETIRDRESSWMILGAALLLVLALDGRIGRVDGFILTLTYTPYLLSTIREARAQRRARERRPERLRALDLALFLTGTRVEQLAGQD